MNIIRNGFNNLLQLALRLDRTSQLLLQVCIDALAIFLAFSCAIFLRLETFAFATYPEFYISFFLILLSTTALFIKMGLYRAFIRYVSTEIAITIATVSIVSAFFLIVLKIFVASFIPWSTPFIFVVLLFVFVTSTRFALRGLFYSAKKNLKRHIAIYGAGLSGAQFMKLLSTNKRYVVKLLIDDNPRIQGRRMYGLRIKSFEEAAKNFKTMNIESVLLAINNADFTIRQNIFSKINKYSLPVKTIPVFNKLIHNSSELFEFRDISIDDLLGRESVRPLPELFSQSINKKIVLVTGAGGSIGSELCQQIIHHKPKTLILLDVSELAIYNFFKELESQGEKLKVKLVSLVGTVQDRSFIKTILRSYKIDTIFHAAAYKHVPLMEQNMVQALKNNTFGTLVMAEEAANAKVASFTLISTDKAVNPTNIMGASKRLAERICQSLNFDQSFTKFSIVRFGNVLGSSGSVVPLFQKQIATGGPITLTHLEVTRYFMTISEAVQLVIQTSSITKGGEVFVLDMGTPIKIKDLAFNMAQLSGLKPYIQNESEENDGDIAIKIIGLRQGEKMFEELSYAKNLVGTVHPRIMKVTEKPMNPIDLNSVLYKIKKIIETNKHDEIKKYLIKYADYIEDRSNSLEKTDINLPNIEEAKGDKVIPLPIKK